jgi:hypothetical protein
MPSTSSHTLPIQPLDANLFIQRLAGLILFSNTEFENVWDIANRVCDQYAAETAMDSDTRNCCLGIQPSRMSLSLANRLPQAFGTCSSNSTSARRLRAAKPRRRMDYSAG